MYPTLKDVYFELRRIFPMLPASQMLKLARSSIALRERLLAKRSNEAPIAPDGFFAWQDRLFACGICGLPYRHCNCLRRQ